MARYRGQKALYEVIGGRARNKSARPAVEPLKPDVAQVAKPVVNRPSVVIQEQPKEKAAASLPSRKVISWKQKPIQWHDGRIEITLSTRTTIMAILCLTVVLLACFKAGQLYPKPANRTFFEKTTNNVSTKRSDLTGQASTRQNPPSETRPEPKQANPRVTDKMAPPVQPIRQTTATVVGNAIVIQEFNKKADLVAVGRFFASKGILTEIVRKEDTFYLITQERFQYNPASSPQTAGNKLLEEIRSLGKEYKAPPGQDLQSFPNKFKDAYGRNIDDQYIGEVIDVP